MSEEEDFLEAIEPTNIILYENTTNAWFQPRSVSQLINFGIILLGIIAHLVIIYTMLKSKRLKSRTNIVLTNWIIYELTTHNILYPIEHLLNIQDYGFLARMICANLWLLSYNCTFVFLHVLLTDSMMTCTKTAFRKFLERLYSALLTIFVFIIFWKMMTFNGYVEAMLLIAFFINLVVLIIRWLHKQCYRIIKCQKLYPNAALRLHIVTLFLVAHVLVVSLFVMSVIKKSIIIAHFATFWHLSGYYVIVLLLLRDPNFKTSICELLGIHLKESNEGADSAPKDETLEPNNAETIVQLPDAN